MPTLNVTGLPEETMNALTDRAYAEGYSDRLSYVRHVLNKLASEPIIRERYAYQIYGKKGRGKITRHSDHPNGTGSTFRDFDQEEADAIHKAENLIRRNGVGDREKAVALLQEQFSEVFEVPV